MGILRRTNKKNSSIANFDPFEGLDDSFGDKNVLSDFFEKSAKVNPKNAKYQTKSKQTHGNYGTQSSSRAPVGDVSGGKLKLYAIGFLLVALTGFAVAKSNVMSFFTSKKIVYAYFEVRALDSHGRPIAGAIVKNGGKRVGTTDSFGEWRRYMQVPLGATVPVTLAKKTTTEVLFATKNFAVPPVKPEHSEIELRGSVQLLVADHNNAVASQAVQSTPADLMRGSSKDAQTAKTANTDVMTAKAPETEDANKQMPSAASAQDKSVPSNSEVKLPEQFVSNHTSIWIEGSGSTSAPINREVVPAMVQRAKEIGLKIDPSSPWKVRLTSLLDKPSMIENEGGGLILVSSFDGENGGVVREFLRNYQADARVTARGILFILAHHINKNVSVIKHEHKWLALLPAHTSEIWRLSANVALMGGGVGGASPVSSFLLSGEEVADGKVHGFYLRPNAVDPCPKDAKGCELRTKSYAEVSPVPTWTKLKLKTNYANKDPMKIFVSGYEAKSIGDKVYEYWGQDKSRANVTVVQNGRVLLRTQVVGDALNPAALGVTTISRR